MSDIELIGEGGRYGENIDLDGSPGRGNWFPGGGSGGGGGGGGGGAPSFFSQFSGGQAPGFGGFPQQGPWAGGAWRRRLRPGGGRMAFDGGAGQPRSEGGGFDPGFGGGGGDQNAFMQMLMGAMGGGGGGGGGSVQARGGAQPMSAGPMGGGGGFRGAVGGTPGPGDPKGALGRLGIDPAGWGGSGGGPTAGGPYGTYDRLIQDALRGGAFGMEPPSGIMAGMRGQAIQDAGARERAARVGLQSRGDTDPSTYGFQALMSQLGGQDQTAKAMSNADLGLRQQQLAFIQDLLKQWYSGRVSMDVARTGQPNQGFDVYGFLQGNARAAGAAAGGG